MDGMRTGPARSYYDTARLTCIYGVLEVSNRMRSPSDNIGGVLKQTTRLLAGSLGILDIKLSEYSIFLCSSGRLPLVDSMSGIIAAFSEQSRRVGSKDAPHMKRQKVAGRTKASSHP